MPPLAEERSARAQEKEEEEEEKNTQEFTFKTFALRTPSYFKEVDVDYEKGGLRGANGLSSHTRLAIGISRKYSHVEQTKESNGPEHERTALFSPRLKTWATSKRSRKS